MTDKEKEAKRLIENALAPTQQKKDSVERSMITLRRIATMFSAKALSERLCEELTAVYDYILNAKFRKDTALIVV
ncbi:MAG: hypothetical protein WC822_06690, partial [Candidatus Paceibacterota bacterium]